MRSFDSRRGWMCVALLLAAAAMCIPSVRADEAQWIWSAEHARAAVPHTACHFRKVFQLAAPREGSLAVAADDQYEVFVNGRRVGTGESVRKLDRYNITRFLTNGRNLVAVRVTNTEGATAALVARLEIKDSAGRTQSFGTDESWVSSLAPLPFWYTPLYNDARWEPTQAWGPLGGTPPWDAVQTAAVRRSPPADAEPSTAASGRSAAPPAVLPPAAPEAVAPAEVESASRFRVDSQFAVDELLGNDSTGSLIAMAFNEFGHIVASREGGELLLIYDSDKDQQPDKVRVYCDQVKDCQGLLCLNGLVYATGEGPAGRGLYRLRDENRDGQLEDVALLAKFETDSAEYGPHGLTLGSDGQLYLVAGSHTQLPEDVQPVRPSGASYPGQLEPRAAVPGQPAGRADEPGGVLLRMDLSGKNLQVLATGLRNAYDLAFDRQGELFTFDGDPEADLGAPWYRPSALYHVAMGAEFGWRSGTANWPDYYLDRLPPVLEGGRAAPTGMVFYRHYLFPEDFHDSLFVADWAAGRILNLRLKPSGGSYTANSQVFLEGDELSISDVEVGPDGWLYFVTGGRGTVGGLYRVRWKGTPPPAATDLGKGLSAAIRQPQLDAAWSRQKIAAAKLEMGGDWDRMIRGVAISSANPWQYRIRALDLMQLYGPSPAASLLVNMSQAKNEQVRAKAAELMGIHTDEETREALIVLLADGDRGVRRKACEALLRAGQSPPLESLLPLLKSDDRSEAWAARNLLERLPTERWRDELLASDDHRLLIQASLALLIADPNPELARDVLDRIAAVMQSFVSDRDFLDMLRLVELALIRGNIQPSDVPQLTQLVAAEFPSSDTLMNRELVRLLAYLQPVGVLDRCRTHLDSADVPDVEKLHLAMHLQHLPGEWTGGQRMQVLEFLETAKRRPGGSNYAAGVTAAARAFAETLSAEELQAALAEGARRPAAALLLLYQMPEKLDAETFQSLRQVDQQLLASQETAAQRLKIGITAVMARSGDPDSLAYLHSLWEVDPERRPAVAMGLAQWPSEENWHYLVRSLPVLDGEMAREVLTKLRAVALAPEDPEYYRQVILRGLHLGEQGAAEAVALLEFWTGEKADQAESPAAALVWWQKWYAAKWPESPDATLPMYRVAGRWSYLELLRHLLVGDGRLGSPEAGAEIFLRAQCAGCHRFGSLGTDQGLELTAISRRAMKKEILESVLFPSHTLPESQRAATVVTVRGRILSGQLVEQPDSQRLLIRQSDGRIISLAADQVEEILPDRVSAMPEGLLDDLQLKDIADLFALLYGSPPALVERPQRTILR